MNNDRRSRRFLPYSVQHFLFGRARQGNNHVHDPAMTPVEHQQQSLPTTSNNSNNDDARSDTSMPDLQSVSDSESGADSDSDSQDARDVEMHVVQDDNNPTWTDDDDIPPLEPIPESERSSRRVTVQDDTSVNDNQLPPRPNPRRSAVPPWSFGANLGPQPADFRRVLPLFSQGPTQQQQPTPNPPNGNPENNAHQQQQGEGRPHIHAHAYMIGVDGSGRPVPIHMPPGGGGGPGIPMFDFIFGPNGPAGMFNGAQPANGGDMPTWADIMQMFGREEESEDPERANQLIVGLEEVPAGLVKRMMRVGGAPGGHVDEARPDESEMPGCAICWDTLLNESGSDDEDSRIISLPCSHVFHASCLIPWFSKPRQTTCPTCRFNIDPENLTYNPRRRQPAAPQQEQPPVEQPTPIPAQQPVDPTTTPLPPSNPPTPRAQPPLNEQQRGLPPLFTFQFPFPQPRPTQTPSTATSTSGTAPASTPFTLLTPRTENFANAHTHAPGFTVDVTWQIPVGAVPRDQPNADTQDQRDDERIGEEVQNQAHAFIRQFLGLGAAPFFEAAGAAAPGGARTNGNPNGSVPMFMFGGSREPGAERDRASRNGGAARPRKEWTPPPAPGPTLRQRVEKKEREAGLRCDDASCGVGPSDDDPYAILLSSDPTPRKQIFIKSDIDGSDVGGDGGLGIAACSHRFHPACLVSADRCSGWGLSNSNLSSDDREHAENKKEEWEVVSCPMCRATGKVGRGVWDEGVRDLIV